METLLPVADGQNSDGDDAERNGMAPRAKEGGDTDSGTGDGGDQEQASPTAKEAKSLQALK